MNDTDSYTSFESKIWKREFDGVQHFVSVARVGLIVQEWYYDSKEDSPAHSCDLQGLVATDKDLESWGFIVYSTLRFNRERNDDYEFWYLGGEIWKREFDGGRGWQFVQVNKGVVIQEWRVPKDGLFHCYDLNDWHYDFRGLLVDAEDLQSFGFVRVWRDG